MTLLLKCGLLSSRGFVPAAVMLLWSSVAHVSRRDFLRVQSCIIGGVSADEIYGSEIACSRGT